VDAATAVAVEAAAVEAAVAADEAALAIQEAMEEVVKGGLVVELSELEGLAGSLGRIGLAPELSRVLNGDLEVPVRIVIDADEYLLPAGATLNNMLILVQTDGVVSGTVASNVLVAEGTLLITEGGRIEGDVIGIDASITNYGTVVGDLRDARHVAPVVIVPPVARQIHIRGGGARSISSHVFGGLGSLAKTISVYLLFGFLGALIVYFFRGHLETVSDTVSFSFGRSFLAGLAAEALFAPIGLVLALLVITAIAVPFYVIAFILLALLGYISVAHAAGENLTRHRFPEWAARLRRSNSYYYVLNGLGVLLALFAGAAITEMLSPLLGWAHELLIASAWILTWVAATSGLGAAVLSRAGTRRSYARPRELAGRGDRAHRAARRSARGRALMRSAAIVAALALAAVALTAVPADGQTWRTVSKSRKVRGQEFLDVDIEYAVGHLKLRKGSDRFLYRLDSRYDENAFILHTNYFESDGRGTLKIDIDSYDDVELDELNDYEVEAGELTVELSGSTPMALDMKFGAVVADLDLGGMRLRNLVIQTGAADANIRFSELNPDVAEHCTFKAVAATLDLDELGNSGCQRINVSGGIGELNLDFSGDWKNDATADINVGLGGIEIRVPAELGVRIEKSTFLMAFDAPGFLKQEGGVYVSRNWDTASHQLTISVSGALGGIKIARL
jgi:hypothetical protein